MNKNGGGSTSVWAPNKRLCLLRISAWPRGRGR